MLPSVAVIVRFPAVVVLVTVAVYVPSPWSTIEPKSVAPEDNVTVCPKTGLPFASVTVAVAVEVEVPLATIGFGLNESVTFAAGPAVCVRMLSPDTPAVLSVAVIVGVPAVVELVSVAEYDPSP